MFRFGDIEVDAERCEVRRGGAVVDTTATGSSCCRSSSAIADASSAATSCSIRRGVKAFLTDRVVDNHIVALRRKIEPDPAEPNAGQRARAGVQFDG